MIENGLMPMTVLQMRALLFCFDENGVHKELLLGSRLDPETINHNLAYSLESMGYLKGEKRDNGIYFHLTGYAIKVLEWWETRPIYREYIGG